MIFDHLHARAFQYTPQGRTIVGPAENVKSITKTHLHDVIVASGVVKDEDAVALVDFFFTKFSTDPTIVAQLVVQEPTSFTGSEVRIIDDDIELAHFTVAFIGTSYTDSMISP
ncbi:probable mitochondrial-processing peptidase subunit beta, mitochondrial [Spinacia oleracea]|uniref:Probable mitochondrial-processing peptidase subunit beta, mitochondrial n=1 Tax=Spinacia oleracea TaxID=3562 RepID=A0ABM3RAR3_SPIOL|nr:probable mitochondrial-processing peptidase subunit beta, mitochondrial [Spinacia oleracea]XP_056692711.1 probable mitochondrial-processing peptidase subunit beta, mitochondrial [Spinacia oleracea]